MQLQWSTNMSKKMKNGITPVAKTSSIMPSVFKLIQQLLTLYNHHQTNRLVCKILIKSIQIQPFLELSTMALELLISATEMVKAKEEVVSRITKFHNLKPVIVFNRTIKWALKIQVRMEEAHRLQEFLKQCSIITQHKKKEAVALPCFRLRPGLKRGRLLPQPRKWEVALDQVQVSTKWYKAKLKDLKVLLQLLRHSEIHEEATNSKISYKTHSQFNRERLQMVEVFLSAIVQLQTISEGKTSHSSLLLRHVDKEPPE
jgi:hypothetical protein